MLNTFSRWHNRELHKHEMYSTTSNIEKINIRRLMVKQWVIYQTETLPGCAIAKVIRCSCLITRKTLNDQLMPNSPRGWPCEGVISVSDPWMEYNFFIFRLIQRCKSRKLQSLTTVRSMGSKEYKNSQTDTWTINRYLTHHNSFELWEWKISWEFEEELILVNSIWGA